MTAFYSWTAVTVEPPPFSTTALLKETSARTMFAPFADSRETPATSPTTSTRGSRSQQNFKTMHKIIIQDCIQYFNDRDMTAYEDDGSVYLRVGNDIEVQLSTAEVIFRADEYSNEKNN